MFKKKLALSLILALSLSLTLVGCGDKEEEAKEAEVKTESSSENSSEEEFERETDINTEPVNDIILSENHPRLFDDKESLTAFAENCPEEMVSIIFANEEVIGDSESEGNVMKINAYYEDASATDISLRMPDTYSLRENLEVAESYLPDESVMKYYDGPSYIKYYDEDGFVQYRVVYEPSDETKERIEEDETFPYRGNIEIVLSTPENDSSHVSITNETFLYELEIDNLHKGTWDPEV